MSVKTAACSMRMLIVNPIRDWSFCERSRHAIFYFRNFHTVSLAIMSFYDQFGQMSNVFLRSYQFCEIFEVDNKIVENRFSKNIHCVNNCLPTQSSRNSFQLLSSIKFSHFRVNCWIGYLFMILNISHFSKNCERLL